MKILLAVVLIMSNLVISKEMFMQTDTVALRYIAFLDMFHQSKSNNLISEISSLFSPEIKKVVNSQTVCSNREELIKQMDDVVEACGIEATKLLEFIMSNDNKSCVLRWEITYKDNTAESIITILKYDEKGSITEINEVFGQKGIYQWP